MWQCWLCWWIMGAKYFQFHVTNFSEAQIASNTFTEFLRISGDETAELNKVLFNHYHIRMLFPTKCWFLLRKLASARNFWYFRQLKMPRNPLEAARCIFWWQLKVPFIVKHLLMFWHRYSLICLFWLRNLAKFLRF